MWPTMSQSSNVSHSPWHFTVQEDKQPDNTELLTGLSIDLFGAGWDAKPH